ncbi:MAG: hypothetical protein HMLKMBBP_03421 [Planctomycetes bacterium]|nr:hypothetical protein [Planctomycetota bacterium]
MDMKNLLDPVFMHLRVNHFPVILGAVGAAACLIALLVRKDGVWRYAAITMLLAGLTSAPAYFSGERAEEVAEGFEYIDAAAMGDHEDSAKIAFALLLVAGVAAALHLKKLGGWTKWVLLATSLAAAGACFWTSKHAGGIVHGSPMLR